MNKKTSSGLRLVLIGIIILLTGWIALDIFEGKESDQAMKEVSFHGNEYTKLIVDVSSVNVILSSTTDDEIYASLTKKNNSKLYKSQSISSIQNGDELVLKVNLSNSFLFNSWKNSGLTLEVKLPSNVLETVMVDASSGNISIDNVSTSNLQLETKSGNINASSPTGTTLKAEARSGNIKLNRTKFQNHDIHTTSGNISLNLMQGNDINLQSTSGNISAEAIDASNHIVMETTSGNIKASNVHVDRLVAYSTSGSVKLNGQIPSFEAKSSSGNIDITTTAIKNDSILKSSSGNIDLTLQELPQSLTVNHHKSSGSTSILKQDFMTTVSDRKQLLGKFGDGAIKLDVETNSGDFKLQ